MFNCVRLKKLLAFLKGSLTENNGTITNVQLPMNLEIFNFFENFKYLLMGGPRRKTEKFCQIEKKGYLYEV